MAYFYIDRNSFHLVHTLRCLSKFNQILPEFFNWLYFRLGANVRVYDQLRLQSADVSSYDDIERSVTDVSVLYVDSDAQTTDQAIGYTRCCEL
jgi:hypothetical protein